MVGVPNARFTVICVLVLFIVTVFVEESETIML